RFGRYALRRQNGMSPLVPCGTERKQRRRDLSDLLRSGSGILFKTAKDDPLDLFGNVGAQPSQQGRHIVQDGLPRRPLVGFERMLSTEEMKANSTKRPDVGAVVNPLRR